MISFKYYSSYKSFLRKNIAEIFTNAFDNDRSAIMSRDNYIQRNESHRSFSNI